MPLEINVNGGGERQCPTCGAWFTPPPDAIYWRFCSTDCWREAEDEREHDLVERGRQMERRTGRQASEAELQAARAEGYRQGHQEGHREGFQVACRLMAEEVLAGLIVELRDGRVPFPFPQRTEPGMAGPSWARGDQSTDPLGE